MRHHVKFHADRSNRCGHMAIFRFLKMAAVRHPGFYGATLWQRGICCRRVSVCWSIRLSGTSRYYTKMGERRITKTTRYTAQGLQFSDAKDITKFQWRHPNGGAKQKMGRLKSAIYDECLTISQKRCKIETWNYGRLTGNRMRSIKCWLGGTVVERRSVTSELSLSYARPAADAPISCKSSVGQVVNTMTSVNTKESVNTMMGISHFTK